jgi:sortase family protein
MAPRSRGTSAPTAGLSALRIGLVLLSIALLCACGRPADRYPATSARPVETAGTISTTTTTGLGRSEPTELWIPRIEARSSLISLGLNKDGTVEVPPVAEAMQAGWYSLSATPGEAGPAVILGHVDGNRKPGIFYRLRELVPGDDVEISRMDGSVARFVVRKVSQVPKAQFPTEAVYGDTTDPELRLITCGGRFDRATHSYFDNIIVYATLR